jgi:serine/threonine protein kinase
MKPEILEGFLTKRKPIAEGACGSVYKFRYNGIMLAIKLVPYEYWQYEYKIHSDLCKIISPIYIPEIINIGVEKIEIDNEYMGVIPMKFVYGMTIRRFIYEFYEDTENHKLYLRSIMTQVRKLLIRIWKAGYVHGDLHLGNLMITPELRVVILDFTYTAKVEPLSITDLQSQKGIKIWFLKNWNSNYGPHHENADYSLYDMSCMRDRSGMFDYEREIIESCV